ncbi:MAG: DUF7128 family protein [Terriglobia bacterium]
MLEKSEEFRWHQCAICGKVFDSEAAQQEHERRCKKVWRSRLFLAESDLQHAHTKNKHSPVVA